MLLIGKVYLSSINFYDVKTNSTRRKARPVLIVGGPSENDYTVLPISTIPNRQHVNVHYDIHVSPTDRTTLNLDKDCYIRTHKQLTTHKTELVKELGNMKDNVPDLYISAIEKMEEFQKNIIESSI